MARIARVVVPHDPHHVTQRGNRRRQTFFIRESYGASIAWMSGWFRKRGIAVWGYSLTPDHVRMIAVPSDRDGLRLAVSEARRRYARRVNFREGWRAHLWQGGSSLASWNRVSFLPLSGRSR